MDGRGVKDGGWIRSLIRCSLSVDSILGLGRRQ